MFVKTFNQPLMCQPLHSPFHSNACSLSSSRQSTRAQHYAWRHFLAHSIHKPNIDIALESLFRSQELNFKTLSLSSLKTIELYYASFFKNLCFILFVDCFVFYFKKCFMEACVWFGALAHLNSRRSLRLWSPPRFRRVRVGETGQPQPPNTTPNLRNIFKQ